MGIEPILRELRSDAADKYREELNAQLMFTTHDDCDYNVAGVHIPFLDYVKLLQEELVRVTMGKGDDRRPCLVSRKEEDLRYKLARGEITYEQFIEAMIEEDGK